MKLRAEKVKWREYEKIYIKDHEKITMSPGNA